MTLLVGCAAEPPRIATPERCLCPVTIKDCDRTTPTIAGRYASPRPEVATTHDPALVYRALDMANVPALAGSAATTTCVRIASKVTAAFATVEPDLVSDVRVARAYLTAEDATSPVEREIVARVMFDDAIAAGTHRLAKLVESAVLDDVLNAPETAHATLEALNNSFANDTSFRLGKSDYMPIFLKDARMRLGDVVTTTSTRCAREAVDARRGKYVAIFRGKA
jgi:hypothetical protein